MLQERGPETVESRLCRLGKRVILSKMRAKMAIRMKGIVVSPTCQMSCRQAGSRGRTSFHKRLLGIGFIAFLARSIRLMTPRFRWGFGLGLHLRNDPFCRFIGDCFESATPLVVREHPSSRDLEPPTTNSQGSFFHSISDDRIGIQMFQLDQNI